jgi:biotin carboxylase
LNELRVGRQRLEADPVGEKAKQTFAGNYTSARDLVTDAKTQLDAASPTDFDAQTNAANAMTAAQETALKAVGPGNEILSSPELTAAFASAENCG